MQPNFIQIEYLQNYCKNHSALLNNYKNNHWWTTALQSHSTTETLHLLKSNKSVKKSAKFNCILQETVSNIPASSTEKTNKYQQKRRRKTRSENQARDEWQSISTIITNLQLTLKHIIPALQPKSSNKQSCNQTLAKSNLLKNYCNNILHCWTTAKSITGEPLHCNNTQLLKHYTCLNRTSLQKSLQKFNYILQQTVRNIPASSTEKTNKYQQKRRSKTRSENQARDEWQSISKGACTTDQ